MTVKAAFPVLDVLHFGMILAALALAYFLPFELVLLSYAILGPLHYLTEISWLHQRSYFVARRSLAWVLVVCTLIISALIGRGHDPIIGFLLCIALAFSVAFTLLKTNRARVIALLTGLVAGAVIAQVNILNLPLITLLPTVIHVSAFTFLFMLVGALRSRSFMQGLLIVTYLFSIALIFTVPPSATHIWSPEFAAQGPMYFGAIGDAFGQIFGSGAWPFDTRLAGFLSFIYTYHYLNWFLKVNVIKWGDVSKERLLVIAILGVGMTSLYFINYTLGFLALLSLSLLHVLLEFPLNAISIRELTRLIAPSRPVQS